ncbi:MAG: carbohydrate ABC transporter permease [Anaerolineae bacterium]|nr:carbohydrate ABC transporter permease [Anaerolineae bacterium]
MNGSVALSQPRTRPGFLARRSARRRLSRLGVHGILLLMVAASSLPLVYMVSTSLKPNGTEYEFPIRWIPERFAWENYRVAFEAIPTLVFLRNTLVIALVSLVGELLTASLAAYGFARLRFPGRDALFMLMMSTLMLPFFVIMIPLFVLYRVLGWVNTLYPFTVPAFFGGGPVYIFLLRQFYLTLPPELDDAARIDGAGFFRTWWSVLLPLTRPALATVAILSLVHHWNDFTGPLILLNSKDRFTLALGIRLFRDQHRTYFNQTMAYSTMMTVPIITVFFIFQKYFIKGISMTGLTGR